VVPCFQEAAGLAELWRRVSAVCSGLTNAYELVLVNDGSTDGTWPEMQRIAAQDPHVVAIDLSRNQGHQLALSAGLAHCTGERVLILDADLQDPPELLADMMALCDQGADVVYGQRRTRTGESAFKRFSAFLFYRILNWMADQHIPEDTGDFRLITRRVLDVIKSMPENPRFLRGMVSWAGFRQVPLLYDRAPRFSGQTNYTTRKMLRFALDAVTSFSVRPLRLAFYAGAWLCGAAILLLGYSLYAYLEDATIRGWTSLMAVMLIFVACQFLFLGLIGEYVGRIYTEVKRRPLFVVREIISSRKDATS